MDLLSLLSLLPFGVLSVSSPLLVVAGLLGVAAGPLAAAVTSWATLDLGYATEPDTASDRAAQHSGGLPAPGDHPARTSAGAPTEPRAPDHPSDHPSDHPADRSTDQSADRLPGLPRRRRLVDRWSMGVVLGGIWLLIAGQLGADHPWAIPGYGAVAFAGVVLAAVDWRTRLLPDRVTYPAFGGTVLLLGGAAFVAGEPGRLPRSLAAALVAGLVFLLFARYAGMGLGDVKFAPTLAAALGWLSWPAVATGLLAAFLFAGIAAIVAMTVFGWDRKASLPLGPWLAAGALVGFVTAHG